MEVGKGGNVFLYFMFLSVCFTTADAGAGDAADYEEVARAAADPRRALLVDVREPHELHQLGRIPSAVNIPLSSVGSALGDMSGGDFERAYGTAKPSSDTSIIFYCQMGRRASQAHDKARELGYSKSKTYFGSYNEWASKQKS